MPSEDTQFKKGQPPPPGCTPFLPGNEARRYLITDDRKKEVYDAFCAWLAKGKSKHSFFYKTKDFTCCYKTLKKYLKNEPDVFPVEQREAAISEGYSKWEQIVEDSASGLNEKANTASLQMKMRNMFGWDKKEKEEEEEGEKAIEVLKKIASFVVDSGKAQAQPPSEDKETFVHPDSSET